MSMTLPNASAKQSAGAAGSPDSLSRATERP